MKPTVQNPDFYAVGNDYAQAPLSAFYDVDTKWDKKSLCEAAGIDEADFSAISGNVAILSGTPRYYQDGIYTKLAGDLTGKDPWKDPHGFNKRTLLVDPSAKYNQDLYGVADVIYDNKSFSGDDGDAKEPATDKDLNPALLPEDKA